MKEENVVFMRRFATMAVGNMMEWFDFSSFGALVDIIAINFFPGDSNSSGIQSFAKALVIFGVAFLMRPLGGVFMGWIGDTIGRKKALELSILLMMIPSFLIGCLPTFQQAGWTTTVILVLLRSLQGLAAGGEIVGAFIFTMEAANGKNLGLWGGACKATGIFGNALGVGLVAILRSNLSANAMNSWGWRVPFWAGFVIGVVGLMLRKSLTLDPVHTHSSETIHAPIRAVFSGYKRSVLNVILVVSFWGCGYYSSFVWLAYFLEKKELLGGVNNVWVIMFSANMGLTLALPFGGSVGDYLQRYFQFEDDSVAFKYAMQGAAIFMIILVVPAFLLMITKNDFLVVLGILLLTGPVAVYGGNLPAYMNFQFPYELRYTGIGLAYNLSNAIFASTTSIVQTELVLLHFKGNEGSTKHSHNLEDNRLRPAYYLMFISILSFMSLLFFRPTSQLTAVCTNDDLQYADKASVTINKDFVSLTDTENPLTIGKYDISRES